MSSSATKTTTSRVKNPNLFMRHIFSACLALVVIGCLTLGTEFKGLPPGIWRGVLYLSDDTTGFDERTRGELPFNFEVVHDTPDSFHIVIHNGEERITVTDIYMGVDRRTGRDTLWIDFPVYDSHIRAQYEEDAIEGYWVARNRQDYKIRFKALHGQPWRFFQDPEPAKYNLTGRWDCTFEIETETPVKSIGDFVQTGNLVKGTFLSPTGDDRFLEGVVSGDRLFLSVFDGSHAYLYEAKILPDTTITGIYRSGKHFKTYWEGKRSDSIRLRDLGDPLTITSMRAEEAFAIALPTPDGEMVTLNDPPYGGKPKIVQIMGTWCPNCRDETYFLLEYLREHPNPGFEILGISFERHTDTLKALNAIRTYRSKMEIPYTIVYGGSNNKDKASGVLPMLSKVMAFPTLIFLDAHNKVVAIHTGFSGPATREYAAFKKEFDFLVNKLTAPHE
jgi:thiol-disulfide isomerase/thioredoxin